MESTLWETHSHLNMTKRTRQFSREVSKSEIRRSVVISFRALESSWKDYNECVNEYSKIYPEYDVLTSREFLQPHYQCWGKSIALDIVLRKLPISRKVIEEEWKHQRHISIVKRVLDLLKMGESNAHDYTQVLRFCILIFISLKNQIQDKIEESGRASQYHKAFEWKDSYEMIMELEKEV